MTTVQSLLDSLVAASSAEETERLRNLIILRTADLERAVALRRRSTNRVLKYVKEAGKISTDEEVRRVLELALRHLDVLLEPYLLSTLAARRAAGRQTSEKKRAAARANVLRAQETRRRRHKIKVERRRLAAGRCARCDQELQQRVCPGCGQDWSSTYE